MPLLAATNLKYAIGQLVLLDGLSISIEPGERIGMVGKNGCGKSTLMKTLVGRIKPDSGDVILQKGSRAGYLTQDPELDPEKTLKEEALGAFAELGRIHAELDTVYAAMEHAGDMPEVELERLLKKQADLEKRMEAAGGWAVEHKVEAVLHGLGFTDGQFSVKVGGLSGGQKGRLALAKLLLDAPDILLLDEPTNHLDIAGREWLEQFLVEQFKGSVLIVSHDRYVLDRVVHKIVEVERGRLVEYPGNYSDFTEQRVQRRLSQGRLYDKQQQNFAKQEEYIRRFKAGQRAKQAQGRLKILERAKRDDRIDRPIENEVFELSLPKPQRSGDLVAVVEGASKAYTLKAGDLDEEGQPVLAGQKVLFHDLTVTVGRGDRWGVIGPNGAGKTTLVRCILGQMPLDSGAARIGANVQIGYYSQQADEADPNLRVYEYLQAIIRKENPGTGFTEQQARDLAGAFMFTGQEQEKRLGTLSGGERSRGRLAGLLASAKNLLILDEPTNHLDIASAERIEAALAVDEEGQSTYEGTLVLISHDRALIDATCDKLLVLDGRGGIEVFLGTYTEWHEKQIAAEKARVREAAEADRRRAESQRPKAPPKPAKSDEKKPAQNGRAGGGGGGSGGGGGGGKKEGGFGWMPDERLEAELEVMAGRIKEADARLSEGEVYRDKGRFTKLLAEREKLQLELGRLEAEWLRREESKGA